MADAPVWRDRNGHMFMPGDTVRVAPLPQSAESSDDEVEPKVPEWWNVKMNATLGAEGVAEEDDEPYDDVEFVKVIFDPQIGGQSHWYYTPDYLLLVVNKSIKDKQIDMYTKLYEDECFHDISFELLDGRVGAHKSVLAASSDVFRVMFAGEMKEATSGVVSMPDVSQATLRVFLRLVYCGDVNSVDWKSQDCSEKVPLHVLLAVLKLACKYDVQIVKTMIVETLKRRLEDSSGHVATFGEIAAGAISVDCGPLRIAAAEVAQKSEVIRRGYNARELPPEVVFELMGVWPPPPLPGQIRHGGVKRKFLE